MSNIFKSLMLIIYYTIGNKISTKLYGDKIRFLIVRPIFNSVGTNIKIHSNVYFGDGKTISIGNNSIIGPDSRIILGSNVIIGNDVQIGPRAMILTGNHNFDNKKELFSKQGSTYKPVIIEDDVWVGANVTILPGVTIRNGSVIGAGAVVTKNVDPFMVVAGNPAKIISCRKSS